MQNGKCIIPQVEEMKRQAQCQQSGGTWVPQLNFNGYCQSVPTPCAPGWHRENGVCVNDAPVHGCDSGYHLDEYGNCVADYLTYPPGGTFNNSGYIPPP